MEYLSTHTSFRDALGVMLDTLPDSCRNDAFEITCVQVRGEGAHMPEPPGCPELGDALYIHGVEDTECDILEVEMRDALPAHVARSVYHVITY